MELKLQMPKNEQPSCEDHRQLYALRGTSSTHLNDLRLRVLRPECLRRGGDAHSHKTIWFSI